jgi:cyclopropane fatty-acyl-phospholipid synthase-like methyltransferase
MAPDQDAPTLQQQRQFYDGYWQSYAKTLGGWEIRRFAAILDGLSEVIEAVRSRRNPPQICDLGCGRGWLSGELAKLGPTTGVDLSPEGVALAQKAWPSVKFESADILTWRPRREFDLVVSSEVIEHIIEKKRFIDTVHAILRPGGFCVLTTPNARVKKQYFDSHPARQPIEAWPTPRELRTLFSQNFIIERHDTFLLDFGYSGLSRILSAPKLLRAVRQLGLHHIYEGTRRTFNLGLYQLIVARRL